MKTLTKLYKTCIICNKAFLNPYNYKLYCLKCKTIEYRKQREKWYKLNKWYTHYNHAKSRCTNIKNNNYHRYGGRGIKFLMTIEDFKKLWLRDKAYNMERPSIDRRNNNGNYTYKNCRFIELSENISRNCRGTKNYFAKLTEKEVKEIRKIYKLSKISSRNLAKIYNVSKTNILDIVNRKIWRYI